MTAAIALMCAVAVLPALQQAAAPGLSLRARSFRPGELVIVSIAAPPAATSVAVRAFGKDVAAHRVGPAEWEALAGIDLDVAPGEHEVSAMVDGVAVAKPVQVVARAFPVRKLTVNPDFVNPPKAVAARIEEESRLIERAYASGAADPLWQGPFQRPVPHQANSRFGTRSVFNGEARSPHAGTDFLSPAGTPVRAPNAGRVVVARDLFFAGRSGHDRSRCRSVLAARAPVAHRRSGGRSRAGGGRRSAWLAQPDESPAPTCTGQCGLRAPGWTRCRCSRYWGKEGSVAREFTSSRVQSSKRVTTRSKNPDGWAFRAVLRL